MIGETQMKSPMKVQYGSYCIDDLYRQTTCLFNDLYQQPPVYNACLYIHINATRCSVRVCIHVHSWSGATETR